MQLRNLLLAAVLGEGLVLAATCLWMNYAPTPLLNVYTVKTCLLLLLLFGPLVGMLFAKHAEAFMGAQPAAQGISLEVDFDAVYQALFVMLACMLVMNAARDSAAAVPAILAGVYVFCTLNRHQMAETRPALLAAFVFAVAFVCMADLAVLDDAFFAVAVTLFPHATYMSKAPNSYRKYDLYKVREQHDANRTGASLFADAGFLSNHGPDEWRVDTVFAFGALASVLLAALSYLVFRAYAAAPVLADKVDYAAVFDPDKDGEENLHRFFNAAQRLVVAGVHVPGAGEQAFLANIDRSASRQEMRAKVATIGNTPQELRKQLQLGPVYAL